MLVFFLNNAQGTTGCTANIVRMVFIVFSDFILGDYMGTITHKYPLYRAYTGISHGGTLVGYIQLSPEMVQPWKRTVKKNLTINRQPEMILGNL